MRVLICGSRNYCDKDKIEEAIERYKPTVIIEGGAKGADCIAAQLAIDMGIPLLTFPADWAKHGKAAGPIRNKQMLDEGKPNLVLAFFSCPYEESKGTKNMVEQAMKQDVATVCYGPWEKDENWRP